VEVIMNKYPNPELEKKMEKAIYYASKNLSETKHNSKPVLLHSIRVAVHLYELGYSENIIISAILHDLLEDTEVTYDELKDEYQEEIANIIKSVSFDPNITDKKEQAKILFENCIKQGYEAMIIKCADIYDNMNYIHFVKDKKLKKFLASKVEMFLKMTNEQIGKEIIYSKVKEKFELLKVHFYEEE